MRIIIFCSALLCATRLWAGYGLVQTVDGKKCEGEIRLEKDGLVLSPTNGVEARFALTNLALVKFSVPPAEPVPSPTGRPQGQPNPPSEAPSVPATPPEPPPSSDAFPPAPPPLPDRAAPAMPAGVLLMSGSFVARRIVSADETSLRLFDATNENVLSIVNIARILFQPLPSDLKASIHPGRPGVVLSSKEFVEGEFKGFSDGQIKISSVLFGVKSYDPGQVIAVLLRDPKPALTRYELKTRDESRLLVNRLNLEKDAIRVQDPDLAGIMIAAADLVELKKR